MKEFDYFSGGVPTGWYFQLTLDGLSSIVKKDNNYIETQIINELCFIGLVSYFEAFCKNLFASLINIIPELMYELRKAQLDISIDVTRVFGLRDTVKDRFGFLIAEKYDFGSAKKINSYYNALLKITPFSIKEIKEYDKILSDRNLLIHHGGTITSKYKEQRLQDHTIKDRVYFDSIEISKDSYNKYSNFLKHIAKKMIVNSHIALGKYIHDNKLQITKDQEEGISCIDWHEALTKT
jgi:hypothetical protein